jgi:hypothetical protein
MDIRALAFDTGRTVLDWHTRATAMNSSIIESTADPAATRRRMPRWPSGAAALMVCLCLGGCALPAPKVGLPSVQMPLQTGWFEGETVFYVTTDVSDAAVAKDKQANFAPRLADALPRGTPQPGQPSSVDKVYAVTNFKQASIFASAPQPMGPLNRDAAYSPLWRMVKVTWVSGSQARTLTSEEQVLAAAEAGVVRLEPTRVVLNCPIVHRGPRGGLEGVLLGNPKP